MLRSALVCSGALLLLSVVTTPTHAEPRPMLAVLDFVSAGADVTETELSLLSDVSRGEARRTLGSAYTIITQESIQQLLKAHGKTLEQCQGECETETGKLLGAELVVSGRVMKAFGKLKVNLKLHRTDPPELLDARVLTVDTLPGLEGAVKAATAQILSSLAPSASKSASTPSRPAAPKPPTSSRPTTRETLKQTAKDMAKALAQRAASRSAQEASRMRSLTAAAKKAARKAAKKAARSRVKKATRSRPKKSTKHSGKPERCQGIPWTCIGWIDEGAWLSLGIGPGTIEGDLSTVTDLSMTFEMFKVRYPYDNDSFWFTTLGAFVMPSTSTDEGDETSAQWASVAAGWGFAVDSVTGVEFSAGAASGKLTEDGADSQLLGPVGTLSVIWKLSGVPYRVGLMAATLGSGSSDNPRTAVITNWTVGLEF